MGEVVVKSMTGLLSWASRMATAKLPITISWTIGEPTRREKQNKLAQRWFSDIARHFGDRDREDVRADCKLRFGVPILRAENDAFRASYDPVLKAHPYEVKLAAIKAWDMPVTRLMTVKQMTSFMDAIQREYLPRGVRLTDPEALKYEVME
ncbi:hypothetical protein [Paenirhodobacter populi]|uniref:hypothetical protein n=1 Tax=Paenirhodobacter populi TaxID=2306993 RepID=UPI000FE2AA70|nr:hypothetical protein [Sinirhodobacter populi]RWR09772.1 hypothetical protein D2T32_05370 [Sinirhodobacter populi]